MPTKTHPAGVYYLNDLGANVLAAFSGREYDDAHQENFLKEAGLPPSALYLVKQVHGAEIVVTNGRRLDPETPADGLVTNAPSDLLGILTADCLPVFFWDPRRRAAAIAHAGWRGVHQKILSKMVGVLRWEYGSDPRCLRIAFGPAIRECCYEVGGEFRDYFPRFYSPDPKNKSKGKMDLAGAARDELVAAGVSSSSIQDSGICTVCQNHRFFSARRESTSERILSVIQIRT